MFIDSPGDLPTASLLTDSTERSAGVAVLRLFGFRSWCGRGGGRGCFALRARLRAAHLRRTIALPGREEFRIGLQPVFQVPAGGLSRSYPKLVSPLSDLIPADFPLVLALIFLIGCFVHCHKFVARPKPAGTSIALPAHRPRKANRSCDEEIRPRLRRGIGSCISARSRSSSRQAVFTAPRPGRKQTTPFVVVS